MLWLAAFGLVTMYSAGFDHGTRFVDHARNMALALGILFLVAQVPPQRLMSLAVPLYSIGVALLIATAVMGVTKKGATRWLNVGVVIQPSEILKIAMPLMLVSYHVGVRPTRVGVLLNGRRYRRRGQAAYPQSLEKAIP
jgi:rod shape determining protein RodA